VKVCESEVGEKKLFFPKSMSEGKNIFPKSMSEEENIFPKSVFARLVDSFFVLSEQHFFREYSEGSQMPRHLISDAHEWINEIPTVPIYHLAKPQPRERAWHNRRGKKTLLSLTLVRLCGMTLEV
jgi:hypothetical protein